MDLDIELDIKPWIDIGLGLDLKLKIPPANLEKGVSTRKAKFTQIKAKKKKQLNMSYYIYICIDLHYKKVLKA